MTKHDFIFSHQPRHRLTRHIAFWVLWCLAFNLLFHFPIHVYKGWDVSGPGTKNLQALGLPLFFIKSLIVNTLFGVVIPQIVFTYVLINWLLPNYFYKRQNYFLVAAITACVVLIFYFVALVFKYSPVIYNRITGTDTTPVPFPLMRQVVIIDQLSSLPIAMGFAVMIKLVKRWWLKQKETELLAKEKTKAELQLLKAQVHPHFLFNTLNNIYFFTLTNSAQAPVMIKKLSDLLNYILHECDQPLVPLEKEIRMIRDYMDLEKIRYGKELQMKIDVINDHDGKMIAPLLLIPFIENSFKHGASKMITQPWINLSLSIKNDVLHFNIINSKPSNNESLIVKGNIGLKNVAKRLEILYPGTHLLDIASQADRFAVHLSLKVDNLKNKITSKDQLKPIGEYAMA